MKTKEPPAVYLVTIEPRAKGLMVKVDMHNAQVLVKNGGRWHRCCFINGLGVYFAPYKGQDLRDFLG